MSYAQLTIEPPRRRRTRRKGRTFRARLLGHLVADSLWELGGTSARARRPVWLAYFTSSGEAKPFTANLRSGRKAHVRVGDPLEIPKSSPHRWLTQDVPGGVVTTAYIPELFHLEPPVPFAEDATFVMAPSRSWVERQAVALDEEFGADARDAARAALFAAYLDRRSHLPMLRDLRFHLVLYRAALEEPWVANLASASPPRCSGLAVCNLDEPLACSVGSEAFAAFLVEQTERFHREHLRPQLHERPDPRIDFSAGAEPLQLSLGFETA